MNDVWLGAMTTNGSPSEQPPRTWWQKALMVILAPFALFAALIVMIPLFVIAGISIPVFALLARVRFRNERRFRRLMRESGRFIKWSDLEPELNTGAGTFLIEQAHKRPVRVWWTPDNVLALAPCPPPSADELDILGLEPPHEFVAWCHDRYIHKQNGLAKLTDARFNVPLSAGLFREIFPKANVIDTVYCGDRDTEM